ncbi:MAG TPA: type I methionyl aminopeptidase [Candidatus Fimimonas gallinarum]|uniref:Methionine aminopeptidase n=1 Tax=Candidatus Fimimonas gallinarum TaxID=2840821 RepID=A0A9D1J7Y0_9BACT|nr:type I methionyl aminopeptidase [Candidatus Fimimonas gallinarum]
MILIKSNSQIAEMRKANIIVRDTLELLREHTKEGVSTYELNRLAHEYITKQGAKPSFLNYNGYPASICVSIDCEVVHGIPSKKKILQEGQIVSYDVGAVLNGWHGDAARTVGVGLISPECQKLIDVTEQCFFEGVKIIKAGTTRLGDLGHAIQSYAESFGYGVVRELVGHGIGHQMHEEPDVPNYGIPGHGMRLSSGMTIAVEPMITMGTEKVDFMSDGWTVKTRDRKPASHYENTIAILDDGIEILSL